MTVFTIFMYKYFIVNIDVQISISAKVGHLITKELYEKQIGFQFI